MRQSTEQKLEELDAVSADPVARTAKIAAALGDKHYRVVAKAAELCAAELLYDLEPALLVAYPRFLEKPAKVDPSCFAKKAICRALVALDCSNADFFLAGLRYRQPEPVWGGQVDTAIDVRCSCAMGLVASGYPRALVELTELLNDPEAIARAGAVRAIACGHPREAELLLRTKALSRDAEPAVVGECFTGLLAVEPDESVAFVARYLEDADEQLQEFAALALGESRLDAAFDQLRAAWDSVLLTSGLRRSLLRAAAVHRSDAAFDWLLSLIADSRAAIVAEIIETLAIYKRNVKLAHRLQEALAARGDSELQHSFAKLWELREDGGA